MSDRPTLNFGRLEGIRGLAAFGVVLNHARGHMFVGGKVYLASIVHPSMLDWTSVWLSQLTSLGPQFVIIFFVLSGFSITHSIEKTTSYSSFYLRRFVRLYPPYVGGLFLAWVTYLLFDRTGTSIGPLPFQSVFANFGFILRNLVYMPSGSFIAQNWTLTYEVVFYLIAPVVLALRFRNTFLLLSAVTFFVGLFDQQYAREYTLVRFVFDYSIFFAIGMFAKHKFSVMAQWLTLSRRSFAISAIVLMLVTIGLNQVYPKASFLTATLFSLLCIFNFLKHRIEHPLLTALGKMSYSLYLTHFAAIYLWMLLLLQLNWSGSFPSYSRWVWMTSLPFCLVVAWLFYLLLERPSLQIVSRLREKNS